MARLCVALILMAAVLVMNQDPVAILPAKFTQSFVFTNTYDSFIYDGKVWMEFDSSNNLKNFKLDSTNDCSDILPGSRTCKIISITGLNQTFIFSE